MSHQRVCAARDRAQSSASLARVAAMKRATQCVGVCVRALRAGLVGWLVGGLVGCVFVWLLVCLFVCLFACLFACLVGCLLVCELGRLVLRLFTLLCGSAHRVSREALCGVVGRLPWFICCMLLICVRAAYVSAGDAAAQEQRCAGGAGDQRRVRRRAAARYPVQHGMVSVTMQHKKYRCCAQRATCSTLCSMECAWFTTCAAVALGSPTLPPTAPGPGSPLPHPHRDRARPSHILTGTGLAPPTSLPGPGSPLSHLHRGRARPSQGCAWCTTCAAAGPCRRSTRRTRAASRTTSTSTTARRAPSARTAQRLHATAARDARVGDGVGMVCERPAWPAHWQVHCYSRTSALKLRIAKLEKDAEVEPLLPSGIATSAPGMPCHMAWQLHAARLISHSSMEYRHAPSPCSIGLLRRRTPMVAQARACSIHRAAPE